MSTQYTHDDGDDTLNAYLSIEDFEIDDANTAEMADHRPGVTPLEVLQVLWSGQARTGCSAIQASTATLSRISWWDERMLGAGW